MNTKILKKISILLIVLIITSISSTCLATDFSNIINDIEVQENNANVDTSEVSEVAGKVLKFIRNIAVIAGVILIAVLGIKYMMGSVEEKAEYKKSFIPLVVGAIVVMAATQIATMIFSLA